MTAQRTRNLVFTLYGDYLLDRGPVRVGSLLTLLGKLGASGPWRGMLLEYLENGPPHSPLGRLEAEWQSARPH